AKLREDLAEKAEELSGLEARWEKERSSLNRVGELREQLDLLRMRADRAQREGNLEQASKLLYGEIPVIERQLAEAEHEETAAADADEPRMVSDQVSDEDIANVVAAWTGIPVGKLLQGETEKLLALEQELGK